MTAIDIVRAVDRDALPVQARRLTAAEGSGINREFRDFTDSTWEQASRALDLERELMDEYLADPHGFETALDDDESIRVDLVETLSGLDEGVGAVVMALNAAGCPTGNSCNGQESHREDFPMVLLTCPAAKADLLLQIAERVDAGLRSLDGDLLLLYAAGPRELIAFANELIDAKPDRGELASSPGDSDDEDSYDD